MQVMNKTKQLSFIYEFYLQTLSIFDLLLFDSLGLFSETEPSFSYKPKIQYLSPALFLRHFFLLSPILIKSVPRFFFISQT